MELDIIEDCASNIETDDILINMGEVRDVHYGDDAIMVEYRPYGKGYIVLRQWNGIVGRTFHPDDTLFRLRREGE